MISSRRDVTEDSTPTLSGLSSSKPLRLSVSNGIIYQNGRVGGWVGLCLSHKYTQSHRDYLPRPLGEHSVNEQGARGLGVSVSGIHGGNLRAPDTCWMMQTPHVTD